MHVLETTMHKVTILLLKAEARPRTIPMRPMPMSRTSLSVPEDPYNEDMSSRTPSLIKTAVGYIDAFEHRPTIKFFFFYNPLVINVPPSVELT